jgi:hypothetical protein
MLFQRFLKYVRPEPVLVSQLIVLYLVATRFPKKAITAPKMSTSLPTNTSDLSGVLRSPAKKAQPFFSVFPQRLSRACLGKTIVWNHCFLGPKKGPIRLKQRLQKAFLAPEMTGH